MSTVNQKKNTHIKPILKSSSNTSNGSKTTVTVPPVSSDPPSQPKVVLKAPAGLSPKVDEILRIAYTVEKVDLESKLDLLKNLVDLDDIKKMLDEINSKIKSSKDDSDDEIKTPGGSTNSPYVQDISVIDTLRKDVTTKLETIKDAINSSYDKSMKELTDIVVQNQTQFTEKVIKSDSMITQYNNKTSASLEDILGMIKKTDRVVEEQSKLIKDMEKSKNSSPVSNQNNQNNQEILTEVSKMASAQELSDIKSKIITLESHISELLKWAGEITPAINAIWGKVKTTQ